MVVHNTVPGTATLLRTMPTKQSQTPLKQSLVILLSSFESKWPNNRLPDCHHIHIVVHHTLSGTAAILRSMLTKQQSQGPLPEFMRMQHAVPKTVTLFMCWHPTQSLGLLPFFEPYSTKQSRGLLKQSLVILLSSFDSKWPNNRSPDCHHIHIVEQHTVSGKAAVHRSMLTKQKSQGPLLGLTRMLHTVHKTVSFFIWWCTTQSLGLLPFFEPCWSNSPGDR